MSYYFYILQCSDGNRYYGHTKDIAKRLKEHSKGKVKATRLRRPVELIYFEELFSCSEAFKREMKFKNGRTRRKTINKLIEEFPKEKCQGFSSHLQVKEKIDLCRTYMLHKSSAH